MEAVNRLGHLDGGQRGTLISRVGGVLRKKARNASTKSIIVESRLEYGGSGQLAALSGHIGRLLSRSTNAIRVLGNWAVRTWVMERIGILVDITVGRSRALI